MEILIFRKVIRNVRFIGYRLFVVGVSLLRYFFCVSFIGTMDVVFVTLV